MTALYTSFVASVLFPLHERFKDHDTVAVLRQLEETQWWDRTRLEQLRLSRLQRLLTHAGEHVPYYRDLFNELGFKPGTVTSLADLSRLPLLDKATIRAHTERMKSDKASGLTRSNTGGSAGEPLVFYLGNERVTHDVAAKWRATRWWGVDVGDPEIVVWGSPIELSTQDRIRSIRDRVMRTELLPAFDLSPQSLDRFVQRILERRPRMLFGYPSALARIAEHAERKGVRLNHLGARVAFVTAERLYDHQRSTISRVFDCRVANGYGGRDAGFLAHECPAGGMHITAEDVIIEIVDSEGRAVPAGGTGEIVVTHLASADFPFIRYRTGDVAVIDEKGCECGRTLPRFSELHGRTTDFVVAENGTVMHGLALIYVVRDLPGIKSFQVLQESRHLTRVLLVPDRGFDDTVATRISEGMRARLGTGVEVRVEPVEEIPLERSGKFRYVISRITA